MIVGVRLPNNGNRILAMKTKTIFSGLARLRRSVAIAAVAAVLGAAVPAVAQYYAPSPPPPLRREVVPAPPGAGWVWRAGFWRWNGYRWVWVPGITCGCRDRGCTGSPVIGCGGRAAGSGWRDTGDNPRRPGIGGPPDPGGCAAGVAADGAA